MSGQKHTISDLYQMQSLVGFKGQNVILEDQVMGRRVWN